MPGLYRSLMAFGMILLLGTVIFYLLALITLNLNEANDVISSLVDLLANLGTILGTALATIIAFYFGVRGTESAVEKAAATITGRLDRMPPNVRSMAPTNGDVPLDSLVQVTFSEPINSSTINESTFAVRSSKDDKTIPGKFTLSPDGKTSSFDPDEDFSPSTKYTATVTTGVRDLAGNALAAPVSWSFSTGSGPKGASTQEQKEQLAATDKGGGAAGVIPPPPGQQARQIKVEELQELFHLHQDNRLRQIKVEELQELFHLHQDNRLRQIKVEELQELFHLHQDNRLRQIKVEELQELFHLHQEQKELPTLMDNKSSKARSYIRTLFL